MSADSRHRLRPGHWLGRAASSCATRGKMLQAIESVVDASRGKALQLAPLVLLVPSQVEAIMCSTAILLLHS